MTTKNPEAFDIGELPRISGVGFCAAATVLAEFVGGEIAIEAPGPASPFRYSSGDIISFEYREADQANVKVTVWSGSEDFESFSG